VIVVVDYGAGNLRSVSKAIESFGAEVAVTGDPGTVEKADKLVLPGVGAFGRAVENLRRKNLDGAIAEFVRKGKPFLGICLGLQMLFETSEENPDASGLSILRGKVARFDRGLKVPHLGWNQVFQTSASPLWKGVPDGSFFYFAHSYAVEPAEPALVCGKTGYGAEFASAVRRDNLFGIQFHPEKSQKWGLKILDNFIRL
jgi:imidazole glycerol-phosphate synthase subunit HisH